MDIDLHIRDGQLLHEHPHDVDTDDKIEMLPLKFKNQGNSTIKYYFILGERCSGTNFMAYLMDHNFLRVLVQVTANSVCQPVLKYDAPGLLVSEIL